MTTHHRRLLSMVTAAAAGGLGPAHQLCITPGKRKCAERMGPAAAGPKHELRQLRMSATKAMLSARSMALLVASECSAITKATLHEFKISNVLWELATRPIAARAGGR